MKIKRLFAALLTALMVVSCFSFTANAQETQTVTEPVAYYTAKGAHDSFRVMGGLTKTRMYDAVDDVIFYHHTDIAGGNKPMTLMVLALLPLQTV